MVFCIVWTDIMHMPKTLRYLLIFFSGFSIKVIFFHFEFRDSYKWYQMEFCLSNSFNTPIADRLFRFFCGVFQRKSWRKWSYEFTNDKIISFIIKPPLFTEIQKNIIFCYILYRCAGACSCNLKIRFNFALKMYQTSMTVFRWIILFSLANCFMFPLKH